jgi:hypothetical protein
MKTIRNYILLGLFMFSIFTLVVAPIEIYKTIEARSWDAVGVKVITNHISSIHHDHYLKVEILDLETGKISSNVSVRYGDAHLLVEVLDYLLWSTFDTDMDRYPVGAEIKAFRSPDKTTYVLEQNSVVLMLVLILLACIYPGLTIWSVVTKRSNNRFHWTSALTRRRQ